MTFDVDYGEKQYGTGVQAMNYRVVILNCGSMVYVRFHFSPPVCGKSLNILSDAQVFTGELSIQPQHAAALAKALAEAARGRMQTALVLDVAETQPSA